MCLGVSGVFMLKCVFSSVLSIVLWLCLVVRCSGLMLFLCRCVWLVIGSSICMILWVGMCELWGGW